MVKKKVVYDWSDGFMDKFKWFIFGGVVAVALMFLVSSVLAQAIPCPVSLRILALTPGSEAGLTVVLKDGPIIIDSRVTGVGGEIVFNPNVCKDYSAVIVECESSSKCHKTVGFNPAGFTDWDITESGVVIPCPECQVAPILSFENMIIAIFSALTGAALIYVKDGKVKLDKKGIDKIIEAMPNGTGIRITKSYSGAGSIKHWHRSPVSYHSLATRHKGKYDHNGEEKLFPEL